MKKAKVPFQVNFTKAQAAFAAGSRQSQRSSSPHWQPCSCGRVIWASWGGQVEWIWLLRFVLAVSLPCSQVTRVDLRQEVLGWVPAWLMGVMGGREDRSAWGGWNCHVYPTQVCARV